MFRLPPSSTLFPYTTLFRSVMLSLFHPFFPARLLGFAYSRDLGNCVDAHGQHLCQALFILEAESVANAHAPLLHRSRGRSEEHTSELQSLRHLVCRLLLEKKKKKRTVNDISEQQSSHTQ